MKATEPPSHRAALDEKGNQICKVELGMVERILTTLLMIFEQKIGIMEI